MHAVVLTGKKAGILTHAEGDRGFLPGLKAGHPPQNLMSSHVGAPAPTAPAPAPVAAPRGPRERRVRFGHLALAVTLIVIGALGTVALVTAVSADGEYLALSRDVDFGAQLAEEDLAVVRVTNTPGLKPVPARDLDRVVGLYANVPLSEGTLLTAAQVTNQPIPGPGQHVLGITLRNDRLPATEPRPGDPVLLVATASQGSPDSDDPPSAPRTWSATVIRVAGSGSGGILGGDGASTVTLDVAVATADGPTVATLAASNRLVVILTGS